MVFHPFLSSFPGEINSMCLFLCGHLKLLFFCIHIKANFFFYVLIPRNRIAESQIRYTFNLMRNQFSKVILYCHQQCMRIPFAMYCCQHLVLSFFLIQPFCLECSDILTMFYVCISLMTEKCEDLFIWLLAAGISSFVKSLFSLLLIFKWLFSVDL